MNLLLSNVVLSPLINNAAPVAVAVLFVNLLPVILPLLLTQNIALPLLALLLVNSLLFHLIYQKKFR